jgi:hypothetical protein
VISATNLAKITAYLPAPSIISHHGKTCCNRALCWLHASDRANSLVGGDLDPPVWLRRQYGWAPNSWPIYWCQIPLAEELDCGSLAALATELFLARGQTVFRVQLALRYPREAIEVWRETWRASLGHAAWISEDICYHEACALPGKSELEIWDPTEGRLLAGRLAMPQRYGHLIAMRVFGNVSPESLRFGGRSLRQDGWTHFDQE